MVFPVVMCGCESWTIKKAERQRIDAFELWYWRRLLSEIKKTLTPWKKSYDQPRQHIKKQRHYFVHKGPSSQAMDFPVVMYGCESWTIKKAER